MTCFTSKCIINSARAAHNPGFVGKSTTDRMTDKHNDDTMNSTGPQRPNRLAGMQIIAVNGSSYD